MSLSCSAVFISISYVRTSTRVDGGGKGCTLVAINMQRHVPRWGGGRRACCASTVVRGKKSLLCDPVSELRRGGSRRRAKIINRMEKNDTRGITYIRNSNGFCREIVKHRKLPSRPKICGLRAAR